MFAKAPLPSVIIVFEDIFSQNKEQNEIYSDMKNKN